MRWRRPARYPLHDRRHRRHLPARADPGDWRGQGYDHLFEYVSPFLQATDLAYTNFDGAMLEGSPYTGYPAFNYNPKLATALKNTGISLVSTANNHILDRGPEGLDATLQVFEQNGIQQHGAVASAAASQPRPPCCRSA